MVLKQLSHLGPVQGEHQAGLGKGYKLGRQGRSVCVPHWRRVALLETHLRSALLHSKGTSRMTQNTQEHVEKGGNLLRSLVLAETRKLQEPAGWVATVTSMKPQRPVRLKVSCCLLG